MNADLIHKALANPLRRDILAWLRTPDSAFGHGMPMNAIQARSGLSQSTVSAHLATLQRAGLISSQKIGQWHFFKRNEATIQAFLEQLRQAL